MDSQRVFGGGFPASVAAHDTLDAWDKAKPRGSASLAAILSAFVPTWFTAVLFVGAFVIIRQRFPKIYSPRTFIGTIPEKDRTPSQSRSYFDWFHTLRVVPDRFVLHHQSLDAYLFLRFLRMAIFLCVVGCCLTWPVLIPINATGGGKSSELDRIAIGNIADKKKLYAHAVIAWVFFVFVMFTVARERLWLIGLRQAWNLSRSNAKRLSSRIVLFLSAPKDALEKENLSRYFGDDAVRLWPATDASSLQSLVSDRSSSVEKLESAELSLIKSANKQARKGRQRGHEPNYESFPWDIKKSLRPRHRLTAPGVGKEVDSITHYREEIKQKEAKINDKRESYQGTGERGAAAVFVEFKSLAAAQIAYQQVASAEVLALNPRHTSVLPNEVIWGNLTLPPAVRISQEGVATALVVALIAFWSIPVGFVGAWSNVSYLAEKFKWLSFINKLPDVVLGLLTGLIPPMLTSLLSKYVPNIFRYIFKKFGSPTNTSAELKVLRWFFVFQVVQVFLVTTLSSGAAAVASQIALDPTAVTSLLAERLPSSSNFYLSYFIVQGLTSSSDNLLNYSDLLQWKFYDYVFDKTPRQKYSSYTSLKGLAWGKVFPKYTNFVIIAIAYSCIAPLVPAFAAAGLALFYYSYRYMLLFTVQAKIDTKGECYTLALQQILTGVYLAELCLIGLFSFRKATGPTIMMGVLLVLTAAYNAVMNRYLAPLEKYLPADLAAEVGNGSEEAAPLLAAEEGEAPPQPSDSHIVRLGQHAHVPRKVLDPIARFFQPHIFASHRAMRAWLQEDDSFDADADGPSYKEEDVQKAYLNPALTSSTPVIWLPKDRIGATEVEVRENEEAGLKCSDDGAWLDENIKLEWSVRDFDKIPIFKRGTKW
ncbi:DUF221-domain-containing protein [Aaosphaeria arxii CBS 175.79]|uniref:DUF221-domain-containing protein n=1 Tax=Aaosphaeria arxii CBS 175.79 TaxID=1450172 RepID=A0A6A5YA18_9PLEO|nr:DUF221-domain-containing protein [Aaosphaeria arxii CBS 175.79]KAF2022063.1 DUF221-domain-containing protein [Aaosphaeria arxii CBS 175.79]